MKLKKNKWVTVKLSEVCEKTSNVDLRKQVGKFNYIDIGSINSTAKRISEIQEIDWSRASSRARQIVKKGDTLFSTVRVNLEKIAFVDKDIPDAIASTGFTVIRANERADPEYLFYSTSSPSFIERLSKLQKGTAYPAVSDRIVFNEEILLPPLEEQKEIGSLFQALENAMEELGIQERKMKDFSLRAIADLTGENPQFGNLIDESQLIKYTIGQIAFEYAKREDNPRESKHTRYVGSDSINRFDFKIEKWQSNLDISSSMKTFEPKDYLLVRRSLYASDFRERAPRADFSGLCSGDILTIKENNQIIYDGYLLIVLNAPRLWEFIVANASGSITRRVKWTELSKFEITLPDLETQKQIVELFDQFQILISELKEQKTALRNLKQKLLNEILG